MSAIEINKSRLPMGITVQALDDLAEINTNVFVIISDGGVLKAANVTRQKVDELKAIGFEHMYHGEDFLNALCTGEYAIFTPESAEDIEGLYDETNVYSLIYNVKERLLQAYTK